MFYHSNGNLHWDRNFRDCVNILRLGNFLKKQMDYSEIQKEMLKFFFKQKTISTTYQNLWYIAKTHTEGDL